MHGFNIYTIEIWIGSLLYTDSEEIYAVRIPHSKPSTVYRHQIIKYAKKGRTR